MARLPRFEIPNQPQHIIQRGNNKEILFREESDYQFYLQHLSDGLEQANCQLHSYVLMPNHVHLLVTPKTEDGVGKLMQRQGRYYVPYANRKYERTGTLFEGRYRATVIDAHEYLLDCMRYIELNPVRHNLVKQARHYKWSSYRSNAQGHLSKMISAHRNYKKLGHTSDTQVKAYKDLFKTPLSEEFIEGLRHATNKSWAFGSPHFIKKIEKMTDRQALPKPRGGDRRSAQALAHYAA